nr:uncharacterized protein LOC104115348 [Nicotiana tomentosiformis]
MVKTRVPLDDARIKQYESEAIIQGPAKRLDLSISPSLIGHKNKSTGKFEDLTSPYTVNNKLLILKPWTVNFDFTKEFLTEIPLWVVLPNLPMSCWGGQSLSRIASAIGRPLYADECTSKQKRISYTRMLIEINVTRPLPSSVTMWEPEWRQFDQMIEYDWKPDFCEVCLKIGQCCKQIEAEKHKVEQPRRRRRPIGNAQPAPQQAPQPVGPQKVIQEWRTKKPAEVREKPTEHLEANKPATGMYDHQVPEKGQLLLSICEEQPMVRSKEIHKEDQLPQRSPELSCIREFPALSTSVQRVSNATVKSGGNGNQKCLPTTDSGPLIPA